MTHDHADDAAMGAYLAGEVGPDQRDAFEAHLLTCDRCWGEVDAGRRGRALAEQAREAAPARVRAKLLTAVTANRPARRRLHVRLIVAVAAAVTVLAAAFVIRATGPDPEPAQIAAAVAGYRHDRLPGAGIPEQPGPDLTTLGLVESGAGAGQLAGQPVTGYAYRDRAGRRLLIYLSDRPFPMPQPADAAADPAAAAFSTHHGVAVLCSRAPHTALVLGEDQRLVWQAATALDLT